MQTSTIETLKTDYSKFLGMCASGVSSREIEAASKSIGIPFPADYSEFLELFGGGYARSYEIAGLREWEMAASDWDVRIKTAIFRDQQYPGTSEWVVFSDDGCGNPIGFDQDGMIWISDHDSCECICLERTFEDWLRRWALELDLRGDYVSIKPWPTR